MSKHSFLKIFVVTLAIILIVNGNWSIARPPSGRAGGGGQEGGMKNVHKEAIRERREHKKSKGEKHGEAVHEKREELQHGAQQRIDTRQENQSKRIEHGIRKGFLTHDEVTKLEAQQKNIAKLEEKALADNKLTQAEWAELRQALNEASRCIWAEKHDNEGNQMPVYVLGKNVFAKDDLTAKLQNENLDRETAQVLIKDFKRLIELKHKLSCDDLSDAERNALQTEFNDLLNLYFEIR